MVLQRGRELAVSAVAAFASFTASAAGRQPVIQRDDYADCLAGMWLGECIANWTGLRTEGQRQGPPFYTDDDWLTPVFPGGPLIDFVIQDPWGADDDTDIEYVYLHLLASRQPVSGAPLTPYEITAGWQAHINRMIWVSNLQARTLMSRGVPPPACGTGMANHHRLMIDAQLTTELFGALNPSMPFAALQAAAMPIRTTAASYAAHASQLYVVMYSLTSQVPVALSPRDKNIWLVQRARRYLPDTSKAADIADFVLAEYLDNPDPDNWEFTRDRVYDRYQLNDELNGFVYRGWYESGVNLATGLIALLYGEGDYRRTVQIGTLSGWDSDNGTATMGGLLGLLHGSQYVRDAFPGVTLSDRFNIYRTRDNLPDYLPADPAAEDTFTLMAQRTLPIVERAFIEHGGLVSGDGLRWLAPPERVATPALSPYHDEDARSANLAVKRQGGTITVTTGIVSAPPPGRGVAARVFAANGQELDVSGVEPEDYARWYYSTQGRTPSVPPGTTQTIQVTYDREIIAHTLCFTEGDHFASGPAGGWFGSVLCEVQVGAGGEWIAPSGVLSAALDPEVPFQVIEFTLDTPLSITGLRLSGPMGGEPGGEGFITCAELDALSVPLASLPRPAFDSDGSGHLGIDDLVVFQESPIDLNGDGLADAADERLLEHAVRWDEVSLMLPRN
ncbi:MAG: ADP-ribosylglycohydrolase family protein [Phycisphaerales bacterium]|nr:ADP-ribosylglycohydrolase family protein [Phycisphaerales bacterium]